MGEEGGSSVKDYIYRIAVECSFSSLTCFVDVFRQSVHLWEWVRGGGEGARQEKNS